ncbi:MAG: pseudouridine synthase, RluA family [Planctomycetaceae bacterium]|nr:pseudouridine synthase, RluA family [Planctomycetaceae bacterium]
MPEISASEPVILTVEARAHGWRVDHYLSRMFSNYSRALLQKAIEQDCVLVNGLPIKASKKLRVNDIISLRLPELPDRGLPPEDLPLEIIYEDDVMVVLNKAPGMIVHPGRGHYHGTLAGALQFHFDSLSDVAGQMRPGIVHRLDRDTSGILVVAKTNQIHNNLSGQFERREVRKEYRAIVHGVVDRDSDYIDTYMRIDPRARVRMCVCPKGGDAREANTFYQVLERFDQYTYVKLLPKTGRTHQLRVHMRHIGHPVVADRVYGGREPVEFDGSAYSLPAAPLAVDEQEIAEAADIDSPEQTEPIQVIASPSGSLISRQALHAHRLEIAHPVTQNRLEFIAPLPADMQALLRALRSESTTP